MGWKSTIDVNKTEAIGLIISTTVNPDTDNETLEYMLEAAGFGDDTDKKYYGHNFNIID